jgi:class 3 adenylate cyclase
LPVLRYLRNHLLGARAPALLLVGTDGLVVSAEGALDRYGLSEAAPGARAEELPLLGGILPPDSRPSMLPCVGLDGRAPADIHSIPTEEGVWFLLLDASAERERQSELHQTANDLRLLREEVLRNARSTAWSETGDVHALRQEVSVLAVTVELAGGLSDLPDEGIIARLRRWGAGVSRRLESLGGMVLSWQGDAVVGIFGVWTTRPSPTRLALDAAVDVVSVEPREETPEGPSTPVSAGIATGTVLIGLPTARGGAVRCFGEPVARALWLGQRAEAGTVLLDQRSFDRLAAKGLAATELGIEAAERDSVRVYRYRGA